MGAAWHLPRGVSQPEKCSRPKKPALSARLLGGLFAAIAMPAIAQITGPSDELIGTYVLQQGRTGATAQGRFCTLQGPVGAELQIGLLQTEAGQVLFTLTNHTWRLASGLKRQATLTIGADSQIVQFQSTSATRLSVLLFAGVDPTPEGIALERLLGPMFGGNEVAISFSDVPPSRLYGPSMEAAKALQSCTAAWRR